jgi:type III pantothenate kinase
MLVLDLGNTSLKWARVEGGIVRAHGTALHRGGSVSSALDAAGLPESASSESPVVVNVAGAAAVDAVRAWFRGRPRFIAATASACGVVNGYREPDKLGADRWAALVGARALYRGPCVLVGCGTAMTVDVLDAEGRHRGGYIAPGLELMRAALVGTTHGIVEVGEPADTAWGLDTASATGAGVMRMSAALADSAAVDCQERLQAACTLLLFGGNATRIAGAVRHAHRIEPHLVLLGAARIAEHASG